MQFFADLSSGWPDAQNGPTYILPQAPQGEAGAVASLLLYADKARVRGSQYLNSLRPGQPLWDGDLMLTRTIQERYHYTEVDTHPHVCQREALSTDNGYCRVFLTELRYRYWIMKRAGELDFSCAR